MSAPLLSLRAGEALDDHRPVDVFDPVLDRVTPQYLERYHVGITHLDGSSWRWYLPHLLAHALARIDDPASMATLSLLWSLRPPEREPPRFALLTDAERQGVVVFLDRMAFSERSVWQVEAMTALEEYWAPGALYR